MGAISNKRLIGTAALVTAGALALAACGSDDTSDGDASGGSGGDVKIAAVIKGLDNPFFQAMQEGIETEAKTDKLDTTIQAATSITDTSGQADKLTALAGQDYSCFIVNPISGTNLIQGIAQLAAKDRTIVNIDSPVEAKAAEAADAAPATYIGTDNVQAGELAGQHMVTLIPGGGDVAAIGGIAGDATSNARVEGFEKGIGSDLTVVQTVAADWDRQTALTAATNVLRAHPDLKGFFVANDDMGLGVARAIADAGKTGQVKVISVDGVPDALKAVQDGQVDAVVAQYPYAIGAMGVQACRAAAAGKDLPENVKAPVALVTKDNAAKAIAAAPKPFETYDDPFAALLK